jgi:hypothetical protein
MLGRPLDCLRLLRVQDIPTLREVFEIGLFKIHKGSVDNLETFQKSRDRDAQFEPGQRDT